MHYTRKNVAASVPDIEYGMERNNLFDSHTRDFRIAFGIAEGQDMVSQL